MDSNQCGSPSHLSPETPARVIPRDESNGSAIKLLQAAADLVAPSFFRGRIARLIETANQGVDERATRFGRQGQRIL